MNIIRTSRLTARQTKDIKAVETACRLHDKTTLTYPFEEGWLSFLLYDEDELLSVFSAFFSESDTYECTAFTMPQFRRQGLFVRLLREFLKESGEADLLFPADPSCPDSLAALEAIGAEPLYEEHMMELPLSGSFCERDERDPVITFSPSISLNPQDTEYTALRAGTPAGSFHLVFSENSAYFYGFEIEEALRNRGIGSAVMRRLIGELYELMKDDEKNAGQPDGKPASVRLQVSGENGPALALYEKTGFQITDTLVYYLY